MTCSWQANLIAAAKPMPLHDSAGNGSFTRTVPHLTPQNRILTAKPAATALWDRRVSEAGRVSWEIESAEQVYERVTQASNVSSQTVAILKLSVWSATAVT